jgi:hypothetical protein
MSFLGGRKGALKTFAFMLVAVLLGARLATSQSGASGPINAIVGTPAQAYVGVPYTQGLQYLPTSVPVSYTITNGAGTQLGLMMSVGLGASVSGTPTGTGTALWTIKATPNGGGTPITRVWSVSINPVPSQANAGTPDVLSVKLEAKSNPAR